MATKCKSFCDWCGKEIPPNRWLHGTRIFKVKKRYWLYHGYGIDIERYGDLMDDMICDDCKYALIDFVNEKKKGAK